MTRRDRGNSGFFDVGPELDDVWVGGSPCVDDRFKLVLGEPHAQCSHSFERTDEAAITTGKHRDLPILPKLTINAVLLDGDAEHA
ncbi:hypothetical protein NY035_06700 [Corynebacterium diphtheriae bv. mitis]|uniref:Uncharacterized protein n=1 Tax=Corynebacterium belfantii TaxID=2014537 RepID=A0ABS0LEH8_9CORY|nr:MULTISPECIES: hypothetical protein [Corynebacterium]OWM36887.1 hypothetical protein AZF07_08410 [Corynebacterium diphtheriae subsp. lausannense]ERA51557.1 hypothetical protein B179_09862 [Corynebacterium diphtheriae str. Aberdeen]MBG9221575.1 hypothetical protein [Corynebacterium diphtheriae bv. mitis]MBG9243765.1 hypothetical protein [Corynebacterium belfantii]MBG9246972.1 hypothetical protein [Corynebacterium diphtheriae bv. mitis]